MRYQLKEQFIVNNIDGDAIVMARGSAALTFNGILVLNESCGVLCEHIKDKAMSIDDMADLLKQKYSIDKQVAIQDVEICIKKMLEQGILDISE